MASRRKSTAAARDAEHKRRSKAATLGWQRRFEREQAEFERRSAAATLGWKTRRKGERKAERYERAERTAIRETPARYRPTDQKQRKRTERPPRGFVELKPDFEARKKRHPKVRRNFDRARTDLYIRVGDVARDQKASYQAGKRPRRLSDREKLERMLVDGLILDENLDEVINAIHESNPDEMSKRELYQLFFSPEAA